MQLKYRQSYYKGLVLIAALILSTSCSKGGSQTESPQTQVSEFTAFNPATGLPLKPEDLTADMLKEDPDVQSSGRDSGDIQTMDVHETEVDVQKSKNIMLFGYTPDGSYNSYLTPQCYHTEVERMVASSAGYTSSLAQNLQSWASRCDKELSRYQTNPIATVLKFANTNYDITKNNIKNIDIEFDDKSKMGAILAMKPGKRPLVIFKSGAYSNADDSEVSRNFMMHLFEESPFHVLYLASVTGSDFMKRNGTVALGGMDEGRKILKVVDMITSDPKYKDLIEDVHVVGVSLGSHGVLYSSLYNSFESNNKTKIKSAVALCPVVDLKPTIKSIFQFTVAGIYYGILTRQIFKDVYDDIPILRKLLPRNSFWTREQLYNATTQAALSHYREETSKTPLDMEPIAGDRVIEMEDYWNLNNFVDYADQVKTPTLIVHARDDFLVQSVLNSDELLKKTQNYNSNIGILEFQNGSHCALNVANGWPTISSMLRKFILNHSTYKEEAGKTLSVDFKAPRLGASDKIEKFTFAAEKNKSSVNVKIEYYNKDETVGGERCGRYDPLYAPQDCYKYKIEKVALDQLSDVGLKTPTSDFETQRLTRWFNTHVTLRNKNSEVILGSNMWPTSVSIDTKADFQN